MTEIKNFSNGIDPGVEFSAKKLLQTSTNVMIEIALKPGEIIDTHRNDKDVIFYILKGAGTLTIEEEEYALTQGDAIHLKKNLQRKWNNQSDNELRILAVKEV